MLIESIQKRLKELESFLTQLSKDDYTTPCFELSNATIGEHTRHIIEMFQCLENQYSSGTINYDIRKRDNKIQTDIDFAVFNIKNISFQLDKPNRKLKLLQIIHEEHLLMDSNYNRELLYNLEHCVHHQALIKVAVLHNESVKIDSNFGVAQSTINYRNQCVR